MEEVLLRDLLSARQSDGPNNSEASSIAPPTSPTPPSPARPPQVKTNANLDLPSSLHETIRTVQQLSSGKAPASDASYAEVFKHDCPQFMEHLTELFQEMWLQGEVPQDFKDATIIHLYKRIGNRQLCDNYRGIFLLNIAGNPGGIRPERKTAPVAREQGRNKADMAALSETRFSKQGQLKEMGAGFTFFWSGRRRVKRLDAGVTFAFRNGIVERPPCLPQCINHHLMALRFPLWGGEITILVSIYAPRMSSAAETRNKFYAELHALLASEPTTWGLVHGDFIAHVDADHAAWK
nr:unnamed protein product [Spirometra erinaceieuropaei]